MQKFYDELAPYYKLIYQNWDKSVERQADILDGVIHEYFGDRVHTILDAACGIGTQAIGLAARGYTLTGSDISEAELAQAQSNAAERHLDIAFHLADLRHLRQVYQQSFDLVLACDNAIPHLLTDSDILLAFRQLFGCTVPGGGCIISARDYEAVEKGGNVIHPRTLHETDDGKVLMLDLWEFDGNYYDVSIYVITDHGAEQTSTQVIRGGRYYCVSLTRLQELMQEAGFQQVHILHERFFQPLLVGLKG
jgi:SAM-dependent methyltransferase